MYANPTPLGGVLALQGMATDPEWIPVPVMWYRRLKSVLGNRRKFHPAKVRQLRTGSIGQVALQATDERVHTSLVNANFIH